MNNIGIFSFGRKQSERCPNKMLKSFADTSLTDIILNKFKSLGNNTFFAGYENDFKEKCSKAGVRFIQRDEHSINIDGPITEILAFLKNVEYQYLLIVNACLPFLKTETITSFIEECVACELQPAFSVIKKKNFYLDQHKKPINFQDSLKTINTKTVEPVYEFAHALYFFNKEFFFTNGRYWDWSKVNYIELNDPLEIFDIDTKNDFLVAENIWKTLYRNK